MPVPVVVDDSARAAENRNSMSCCRRRFPDAQSVGTAADSTIDIVLDMNFGCCRSVVVDNFVVVRAVPSDVLDSPAPPTRPYYDFRILDDFVTDVVVVSTKMWPALFAVGAFAARPVFDWRPPPVPAVVDVATPRKCSLLTIH